MDRTKKIIYLLIACLIMLPSLVFAADPDTCTLIGTKVHPFSQPTDADKIVNSTGAGSVPRISPSSKYVASGGLGISIIDLTKKTTDAGHPFESVQLTTDQSTYVGFDTGTFASDEKRHLYFVAPTNFNTDTYIRYANMEKSAEETVYGSGEFLKDTTGNIRLGDVLQKDATTDLLAFAYQGVTGGHPSGVYITEFTNPTGKPQAYDNTVPSANPWKQITMSVPGSDSINNIGNVFWDKSICDDAAACTLGFPKGDTLFIRADCQATGGASGSAIYKVTGIKAIINDPATAVTSKTDSRMVQVTPCLPWLNFPTGSPDGKWIAAASKADSTADASATNKELIYIFPTDGCAKNAAVPLDPTGKFALETSRDDKTEIGSSNIQWSADGGKLLYSSAYCDLTETACTSSKAAGSVRLFSLLATETAATGTGIKNKIEDAGYNKIEIDGDDLKAATDITLSKPLADAVIELDKTTEAPEGDKLTDIVLEVESSTADFIKTDKSADLTMHFSDLDLKDIKEEGFTEEDLTVYALNEETAKWEPVGQATVDAGSNTVSVDIKAGSAPSIAPAMLSAASVTSVSKKYRIGASKSATAEGPFTLSVEKDGSGTGIVTGKAAGIKCGPACEKEYSTSTTVTLTAKATGGSVFSGWSGACTGTGTCEVTVDADTAVTATFTKMYKLIITRAVKAGGNVTGDEDSDGLSCGTTCTKSYASGSTFTLTASANEGYTFKEWANACTGTDTACAVTMDNNKTVVAKFRKLAKYSLKVPTQKGGTVTSSDENISCNASTKGKTCTARGKYTEGSDTVVTLTATPATGYTFTEWTNCPGAVENVCTVTMDGNKTIAAKFTKD